MNKRATLEKAVANVSDGSLIASEEYVAPHPHRVCVRTYPPKQEKSILD